MGLITMSERDLRRIEVLSKVIAGRMTMVSAAHVGSSAAGSDPNWWCGVDPAQGHWSTVEQPDQ